MKFLMFVFLLFIALPSCSGGDCPDEANPISSGLYVSGEESPEVTREIRIDRDDGSAVVWLKHADGRVYKLTLQEESSETL